jgi:hypothetical protein
MPYSLRLSAVLAMALVATACGAAEDNLAVVANAPGTFAVGEPQRLMVGLVEDETASFLAKPDLAATAVLTSPDETETEVHAGGGNANSGRPFD